MFLLLWQTEVVWFFLKCVQELTTQKRGKVHKTLLTKNSLSAPVRRALFNFPNALKHLSRDALNMLPTCSFLWKDRRWMCCRCSPWNSSCKIHFCDKSCNFVHPLHAAANIRGRFQEMLITRSVSQSGNRGTERSLWRLPYSSCCNINLFLEGVVFNTATMPCSLSTDNDGSQLCIPAVKSGARRSYR